MFKYISIAMLLLLAACGGQSPTNTPESPTLTPSAVPTQEGIPTTSFSIRVGVVPQEFIVNGAMLGEIYRSGKEVCLSLKTPIECSVKLPYNKFAFWSLAEELRVYNSREMANGDIVITLNSESATAMQTEQDKRLGGTELSYPEGESTDENFVIYVLSENDQPVQCFYGSFTTAVKTKEILIQFSDFWKGYTFYVFSSSPEGDHKAGFYNDSGEKLEFAPIRAQNLSFDSQSTTCYAPKSAIGGSLAGS
ncbi:MAG: hypothetical protein ACMG57_03920 [Candidatus Dojkabacteria bacterium]